MADLHDHCAPQAGPEHGADLDGVVLQLCGELPLHGGHQADQVIVGGVA